MKWYPFIVVLLIIKFLCKFVGGGLFLVNFTSWKFISNLLLTSNSNLVYDNGFCVNFYILDVFYVLHTTN